MSGLRIFRFTVGVGHPYSYWAKVLESWSGFTVIGEGVSGYPVKMLRYMVGDLVDLHGYDGLLYMDADVVVNDEGRLSELEVPGRVAREVCGVGEYDAYTSAAMDEGEFERNRGKAAINSGVWCFGVEEYGRLSGAMLELYRRYWGGHDQALLNAVLYREPREVEWEFYEDGLITGWGDEGRGVVTHYNGNHPVLEAHYRGQLGDVRPSA